MSKYQTLSKRAYPESEAAHYVGMADATLRQGRCHRKREGHTPVPKHIKIGRSVRYLKEDLDRFLDEMRERTQGKEAA